MPYFEVLDFLNDNIWYVLLALAVIAAVIALAIILKRKKRDVKDNEEEPEPPERESVKKVKLSLVKPADEPAPPPPAPPVKLYKSHTETEEEIKREGEIVVFKDEKGKFRFRLRTADIETIAFSTAYTSRYSCNKAIETLSSLVDADIIDTVKLAMDGKEYTAKFGSPCYEIYSDADGKYHYRLRAANLTIILTSRSYVTKNETYRGIKYAHYIAANHKVTDKTK